MTTKPTAQAIRNAVDARREEFVQMLLDVVGVSSVTGNEGPAQRLMRSMMEAQGLEVDEFLSSREEIANHVVHVGEQSTFKDRPSLVGTRKGSGDGKSLMFNGHIDTVPVEDRTKWNRNPEGEVADDLVYGLGSTDMKSGTLCGVYVARILDDLNIRLKGDLLVNSVTGEEDGGLGTMSTILHGYRPDGVVIPEPTHLTIAIASGGSLVYRITVTGKAAHGANRNAGVSAIEKFIPIFQDLLAWESERQATVHHPLYDHLENKFPISTGMIRAGEWASTVPDRLVSEGRLGFLPRESMEDMMEQTRQRIAAVAEQDDWLREHPPLVEFVSGQFIAEEIAPDHPLVQAVASAHQEVTGEDAEITGLTGGADTRLWVRFADTPALMYGPGTMGLAHQSNESVDIDDLVTCITVLTHMTIDWCGITTE